MKKYRTSIILFLVFEAIAVWLWQTTGNLFFLLNFSYIGICIGMGGVMFAAGWKYAREFTQFGVGTYMLAFLGLLCHENMQNTESIVCLSSYIIHFYLEKSSSRL